MCWRSLSMNGACCKIAKNVNILFFFYRTKRSLKKDYQGICDIYERQIPCRRIKTKKGRKSCPRFLHICPHRHAQAGLIYRALFQKNLHTFCLSSSDTKKEPQPQPPFSFFFLFLTQSAKLTVCGFPIQEDLPA